MEQICYFSAATIKGHLYLSIFVPILVILWIWLIIYFGKRMGLDRFNAGDEDTLTAKDFFPKRSNNKMSKVEFERLIRLVNKVEHSHISKTYSREMGFLNVAYKHERHTINKQMSYLNAIAIIQSLRK